jgi:eukaryotic-like serine/threonine-protein kinase
MSSPSNAPLPDGHTVGGYRIVRKIASGGFSFVYLAQDEHGERFAIKEYLPAALARREPGRFELEIPDKTLSTFHNGLLSFFDEGRALAKISHPNVVRVVNFFRAHGTVYMVMAWERGRTLQEVIVRHREHGRPDVLPERHLLRIFNPVMSGLREVHANRLLHLDLKPGNIYLRLDGSPLLLDFGSARRGLDPDARKLFPMYTPGFAAPELYRRKQALGPWTDVYGLGATMLGCMIGQPPQAADQRERDDQVPSVIAALEGAYSAALCALVASSLALDPMQRPQSVFALQRDLRAIAAARGSRAEPTTTGRSTTIGRWIDSIVHAGSRDSG